MNENQKPFACTVEGCDMTFTNEDHLNWHHKKHDMVLNLGLANKNIEVDQTPTPTRFIRNCEEVGLFQDLQNVNPFDETFKKAIECAKSGSLHVPEVTSNDDTLHTPHIFPHVESASVKYSDNQQTQEDNFCINSVTSIEEGDPNESYDLTIVTDEPTKENTKDKHNELKNKLKETIKNKVKTPLIITPVPLEKLKLNEPNKRQNSDKLESNNNKKQKIDKDVSEEKAKIREMNRAAQLRCRKRKQIQWKKMEEELKILKNENIKINQENQNFKHKFYALKELILKHKSTNSVDNNSFVAKVEDILNSTTSPLKKNMTTLNNILPASKHKIIKNKLTKTPPIVPVPVNQNAGQTIQKPLLIQVMGSVAQLAVSVLPNK